MKRFFLTLSIFISIVLLSCDKIEEPYKNIGQTGGETEVTTRKVLLEDYTGHTCVNCPAAAKLAGELKDLYGDRLIIIAVHAGHFALPSGPPFDLDLRSDVGNEWNSIFGIQGYPSGMINRTSPGGQYIQSVGNWATRVSDIIDDPTMADLKISTSYNQESRRLDISLETTFKVPVTGKPKIQLVITEDNILGAQHNNNSTIGETPVIYDFVHKHVLRAAVNGNLGEDLYAEQGNVNVGTTYEHDYSITLDPDWEADNISAVAFIYNASDYEIYQVEEKHIMD